MAIVAVASAAVGRALFDTAAVSALADRGVELSAQLYQRQTPLDLMRGRPPA